MTEFTLIYNVNLSLFIAKFTLFTFSVSFLVSTSDSQLVTQSMCYPLGIKVYKRYPSVNGENVDFLSVIVTKILILVFTVISKLHKTHAY